MYAARPVPVGIPRSQPYVETTARIASSILESVAEGLVRQRLPVVLTVFALALLFAAACVFRFSMCAKAPDRGRAGGGPTGNAITVGLPLDARGPPFGGACIFTFASTGRKGLLARTERGT